MENIFQVEKKATHVTPSGIEVEIRGLVGKHQKLITVQDDKKRADGLRTILVDCIARLGDITIITESVVDKILSFDRKFILWKVRELSNEDNDTFVFDYEFPTRHGKKLKERFSVDYNDRSFPVKPAIWVEEQIRETVFLERGTDYDELSAVEKQEVHDEGFPIMYKNYETMLEEKKQVEITLPESGVEVFFTLTDGFVENKFAKIKNLETNSHVQLEMHSPAYIDKALSEKKDKKIISSVPLDKLSNVDIEYLRRSIMTTEGNVDSLIVVKSTEDSTQIQQVDLLQTPAFFFASLAI